MQLPLINRKVQQFENRILFYDWEKMEDRMKYVSLSRGQRLSDVDIIKLIEMPSKMDKKQSIKVRETNSIEDWEKWARQ